MENDSDVVFLGNAEKQRVLAGGFVFIDSDREEKSFDVMITTFKVIDAFKGISNDTIELCSIANPMKYVDIDSGVQYLIFAQKTGEFYQRTHGSMSQIVVENGEIKEHFFYSDDPALSNLSLLKERLRKGARLRWKRIVTRPYNPYEAAYLPYKVIDNPCVDAR